MEIQETKSEQKKWQPNKRPTFQEKKAILELIYNNNKPAHEILKEFNVKSPASMVIKRWESQIEQGNEKEYLTKRSYSTKFKTEVVRRVEFGSLSEKDAILQYCTDGRRQLKNWLAKYSSHIVSVSTIKAMTETEKSEVGEEVKPRSKELEKALESANLRIIGLETMIDVAEKQFNIEIRKKAGTKQ